eukprot:29128-Pelagococcus_subviridis.AAC.5
MERAPAKVLKERRSHRERRRMGTGAMMSEDAPDSSPRLRQGRSRWTPPAAPRPRPRRRTRRTSSRPTSRPRRTAPVGASRAVTVTVVVPSDSAHVGVAVSTRPVLTTAPTGGGDGGGGGGGGVCACAVDAERRTATSVVASAARPRRRADVVIPRGLVVIVGVFRSGRSRGGASSRLTAARGGVRARASSRAGIARRRFRFFRGGSAPREGCARLSASAVSDE